MSIIDERFSSPALALLFFSTTTVVFTMMMLFCGACNVHYFCVAVTVASFSEGFFVACRNDNNTILLA